MAGRRRSQLGEGRQVVVGTVGAAVGNEDHAVDVYQEAVTAELERREGSRPDRDGVHAGELAARRPADDEDEHPHAFHVAGAAYDAEME